jgi:CHAT domain-containing protein
MAERNLEFTQSPRNDLGSSLPAAFIQLGAAGVLSTLWPVADASTPLLMAKFYELHMRDKLAPPAALRRAQAWLSQTTDADLVSYAKMAEKQGRFLDRHLAEIEKALSVEGLTRSRNRGLVVWIAKDAKPEARKAKGDGSTAAPASRPYAHPYYWAGFVYTGL